MITLQALLQFLEETFQAYQGIDFGPNGVQVEGTASINRIGLSVSASLEVIHKAIEKHCDVLLVHHGLLWDKESPVICGPKKQKLKLLLANDISLLAYHLPLDYQREIGNNWKAASDLGWQNLQPFGESFGVKIGVQGTFPEIDFKAFVTKLETYYAHPAHIAAGGKTKVRSAALISGGAHKAIVEAVKAGVDCFITGSFDEPIWDIAHENGIHFIALGHHATERIGIKGLEIILRKKFGIPIDEIIANNPF